MTTTVCRVRFLDGTEDDVPLSGQPKVGDTVRLRGREAVVVHLSGGWPTYDVPPSDPAELRW